MSLHGLALQFSLALVFSITWSLHDEETCNRDEFGKCVDDGEKPDAEKSLFELLREISSDTAVVRNGDLEEVAFILELFSTRKNKDAINDLDTSEGGNTALHLAIKFGYPEILEMIIKAGADVNRKNKAGDTPLIFAIKKNRLEMAEILLKNGADAELKSESDELTPLLIAARMNRGGIIGILLDKGANDSAIDPDKLMEALLIAVSMGQISAVKALIEKRPEMLISKNELGQTVLHLAALNGHAKIVQYLVDKGADAKMIDADGLTPFMVAFNNGLKDVVQVLIEAGIRK